MGQITIYLDDELIGKVQEHALSMNVSKSQWIARLIKERTRTEWPENVKALAGSWRGFPEAGELRAEWPENVKALAGSWRDFPEAGELRANLGEDAEREPL